MKNKKYKENKDKKIQARKARKWQAKVRKQRDTQKMIKALMLKQINVPSLWENNWKKKSKKEEEEEIEDRT